MKYNAGDKIKFKEEKQRYTVQACADRYLICTKPFNARKTYLYTIVDLEEKIRGPDNYVFSPHEYNNQKGAELALSELLSGRMRISHRSYIELNIE